MKYIKIDERGREQVPRWYSIAITTNKEKIIRGKVQEAMKKDQWKSQIFNIVLPSYIEVDAKGKEKEVLMYNQAAFIHMILNDETWDFLELLRRDGFRTIMGDASPIPLSEMELVIKKTGKSEEELYLNEEQKVMAEASMIDDEKDIIEGIIYEGEIVLFEKEDGHKEVGVVKSAEEDHYLISHAEDGVTVEKKYAKEKVYKLKN